jgi:hypothetical protein
MSNVLVPSSSSLQDMKSYLFQLQILQYRISLNAKEFESRSTVILNIIKCRSTVLSLVASCHASGFLSICKVVSSWISSIVTMASDHERCHNGCQFEELLQQPKKWEFLLHRVYLKQSNKLQEWVFHTKTRRKVHINTCLQTFSFQGTGPMFVRPQSLRLLSVKPFVTTLTPFIVYDSPRSDASMRSLIQVEDIFSMCCELSVHKQ